MSPPSESSRRYGADGARAPKVRPAGARVNLLYLPAGLLALTAVWAPPLGLGLGLAGAALWAFGAHLTGQGLIAEQAFRARKYARRPAWPRKILASGLIAGGTALGALSHAADPWAALLCAGLAAALHLAAFGPDPLQDRLPEGEEMAHDRALRITERAEGELTALRAAITPLRDRTLNEEVEAFVTSARGLLTLVEEDPRDLLAVRRLLGVYLTGAREASERYAALAARRRSPADREEYRALLHDLQQNFAARAAKMLQEDAKDMTIEIEVLRDRLRREGMVVQAEEVD